MASWRVRLGRVQNALSKAVGRLYSSNHCVLRALNIWRLRKGNGRLRAGGGNLLSSWTIVRQAAADASDPRSTPACLHRALRRACPTNPVGLHNEMIAQRRSLRAWLQACRLSWRESRSLCVCCGPGTRRVRHRDTAMVMGLRLRVQRNIGVPPVAHTREQAVASRQPRGCVGGGALIAAAGAGLSEQASRLGDGTAKRRAQGRVMYMIAPEPPKGRR